MRSRTVLSAGIGLVVLFGALFLPSAEVATAFPGPVGKIVYARGDIYTASADGSGETTLTPENDGFSYRDPNWSATGARIVMSDGYDLWTMYSDGTGKTQITTGQSAG